MDRLRDVTLVSPPCLRSVSAVPTYHVGSCPPCCAAAVQLCSAVLCCVCYLGTCLSSVGTYVPGYLLPAAVGPSNAVIGLAIGVPRYVVCFFSLYFFSPISRGPSFPPCFPQAQTSLIIITPSFAITNTCASLPVLRSNTRYKSSSFSVFPGLIIVSLIDFHPLPRRHLLACSPARSLGVVFRVESESGFEGAICSYRPGLYCVPCCVLAWCGPYLDRNPNLGYGEGETDTDTEGAARFMTRS